MDDRKKLVGALAKHRRSGRLKVKQEDHDKVHKVMHEFKEGELHSGSKSGPVVTDRDQAIAIAMSEARRKKGKK